MLHNGFHYNIYLSNELEDIAGEVQISSTKGFIKRSTFSGLELNPQYLSGMPVQYVCVYVCSTCVCVLSRVQLFSTLWTVVRPAPMSMGILQARMLEWVVISSSRGSSWPRDGSCISCIGRWILYRWTTWETLCLYYMTQKLYFWAFFTEKSEHVFTQKLYVNVCNVHRSFIQNKLSQTGNNPDVFQLDEWLNKLCSVYGILLASNKEQNKNEKITTSTKNNKE